MKLLKFYDFFVTINLLNIFENILLIFIRNETINLGLLEISLPPKSFKNGG
jgi:hypothetical protein